MPFSFEPDGIVARVRASETTSHQTVTQAHHLYYWERGCTVGNVRHNIVGVSSLLALSPGRDFYGRAVGKPLRRRLLAHARNGEAHVHTVLRCQVAPGSLNGKRSLVALAADLSRLSCW